MNLDTDTFKGILVLKSLIREELKNKKAEDDTDTDTMIALVLPKLTQATSYRVSAALCKPGLLFQKLHQDAKNDHLRDIKKPIEPPKPKPLEIE